MNLDQSLYSLMNRSRLFIIERSQQDESQIPSHLLNNVKFWHYVDVIDAFMYI